MITRASPSVIETNPAELAASGKTRLDRLKAQPRRPGEASFFFYDPHLKTEAVKVLPGERFVHNTDIPIVTVLGSCIAACLWDRRARVGGMNHFVLPEGHSESGRYGSYAMELLINEMIKLGAARPSMEAKVFGGGQMISGTGTLNVGERNTRFVLEYLEAKRIPVLARDVLGDHPRKVVFLPASGKALVKRLATASASWLSAQERAAARALAIGGGGGSVAVF